ncbi:MAG TPA: tetratricopeptide repeat protein, partial [Jatrophihabitantaceae bacterium]|nr:tetratricopeptide repeat protein [Jatrophihabitantaceae bacterium]
ALLAYLIEHADACRVVRWRGVAAQAQLPFGALCGLLGELLTEVHGLDGGARSALEGAFGLAEPQPVGRLRIAAAAMTLLAHVADDRPLLLVVDDLHWVDTESIEALFFAVRRLPADPVGLVIATRDRAQGESLGIETLALQGLSDDAVREIVGRDVAGSVCAMISAVTEGNPLASKEIASTLTAAQRVGRAPLPDPLPQTSVERVYMDRIAHAPGYARRAGAVAAAAGDAPLAVVAAALAHLGLGLDALHAIEDAGLLRVEGGLPSWRHPLATSATWRSASAAWQHDAHRALAAAWQRADADGVDRAVWHRAAIATPGDELVASELAGQAQRAAARDAYTTAASGWQIAARLGDRVLRAERLYRAARACEAAGKLAEERALLRELLAGEPMPDIRARSLRALGRAEFEDGTPALALALLADAAEQSADKRDRLWCLSEAVFASMYAEDRTASLRLAAQATTVADHHDPIQRFLALHASGAAQCLTGDLDSGRRSLDEALRTADEHRLLDEHPELLLWVVNAPMFMGQVGDLDKPAVLRTIDAMRRAGDLTWLPRVLRLLGHRHRRAGQWLAAYALFEESVDLARLAGQATQVAEALDALAWIEAARGDLARAIAHAEESRRIAALRAVPWLVPAGWCTEAMARLASGDAVGALAPIEQAMTLASAHGHAHDVDLIADYVEILVAAGHDARARDVAEAVP